MDIGSICECTRVCLAMGSRVEITDLYSSRVEIKHLRLPNVEGNKKCVEDKFETLEKKEFLKYYSPIKKQPGKLFHIWHVLEEYDGSNVPFYYGKARAKTFEKACEKFYKDAKYYDKEKNEVDGIPVFGTEKEMENWLSNNQ